jgi:hypothetical protein
MIIPRQQQKHVPFFVFLSRMSAIEKRAFRQ